MTNPKLENRDYILSNVIPQMVNKVNNRSFLEEVVFRSIEDMAIIYMVFTDKAKNQHTSASYISITNEIAKKLNLTEEELYTASIENMKKIPVKFDPMNSILSELIGITLCNGADAPTLPMYILSMEGMTGGAIKILDKDLLDNISRSLGNDLIILPSSIHEVIILPKKKIFAENQNGLIDMVIEINKTVVSPKEKLSDHVYYYCAADKELTAGKAA